MPLPKIFTKLLKVRPVPLIDKAVEIADRFIDTPHEKQQFLQQAYNAEVQDRNTARELGKDKAAPEIISYFTIALALLLGIALFTDFVSWADLSDTQKGLIQVFFGAILARVNDIYNYWFGSSMGSDLKDKKIK